MKRNDTWRADMHKVIDNVTRKEFVPGEHDCALFVADVVKAITGEDHAKGLRGKYKTLARGLAALKKKGFENHVEYAASLFPEVHPSMAGVGDIVVFKTENAEEAGCALGIVIGERSMVLRPEGMGTIETLKAIRAFKVG